MDLKPKEFVEQLLSKEAHEEPSDRVKPDELVMELPEWYDEKKFNKARKFFDENCFALTTSMLMGLVAVFAVPSILRVLVGSRRSSSPFTAYRRYLSTTLHTIAWFENELKPGSLSWRSLYTVRSRHARATISSKAKGNGIVSQRDVALTQFGFVGFAILRPEFFSVRQLQEGDWDAFNHFWRVIGHMIGLQDRYNICRNTIDETREVLQILMDKVFTPCLENVPEYFEHMARVMLDGMWSVNPTVDVEANLYWCRYLAKVPGYIYTEKERIELQERLKKHLNGKPLTTGIDSSELISKSALDGLPTRPPRIMYYNDYDIIETTPAYKRLTLKSRYKLALHNLYLNLYSSYLGRLYFNMHFKFSLYLMRYFPYLAFFRFGIKASLVKMFVDDPTDDTKPVTNADYYKPREPMPWYMEWLSIIW